MKEKRWFWGLICLIVTIIFYFSYHQWGKINPVGAALTMAEARSMIENRYDGEVKNITLVNNVYEMEFVKEKHLFKVKLDADNREVIAFSKIKSEPEKPLPEKPEPEPEKTVELTEEKIKEIIVSQVPGTISSFKKIEGTTESTYQAIIRDKTNETIVTVGAISGTILSKETKQIIVPPKRLSEEEARQIALANVNGKVDKLYLQAIGNVSYYFVQVETSDGQEYVVRVHTITGVAVITSDDHGSGKGRDKPEDD